jgi:hypothetical protein
LDNPRVLNNGVYFQPLWSPELPLLLEVFKVNVNMKIGYGWDWICEAELT